MSVPSKRPYQSSHDHADPGLPYGDDDAPRPSAHSSSAAGRPKDWRSAFLGDDQPDPRDVDPRDRDRGHRYPDPRRDGPPPARDPYLSSSRSHRPGGERDDGRARARSRSRERYRPREGERDVRPRHSRERDIEEGELPDIPRAPRTRTRSPSVPLAPRSGLPPPSGPYQRSPPRAAYPGDRNGYAPRGGGGAPYGGAQRGGWNAGRGGAAPSFRGGRGGGYQAYHPGGGREPPAPYDAHGEPPRRYDDRARSPPPAVKIVEPVKKKEEVVEEIPDEVDEEEALAERRRKRAQILEKFSGATSSTAAPSAATATLPPLPPAAAFAPGVAREMTSSPAPSPSLSGAVSVAIPPTPSLATTPLGAFDLEKHTTASASSSGTTDAPLPPPTAAEQADEISAADYDPSLDGRAEEVRRMQVATEGAAPGERAADIIGRETQAEMAPAGVKIEVSTGTGEVEGDGGDDEEDSDDSDDDMFAVDVDKPKKPKKAKTDVPMITRALPSVPQSAATLSDNFDTADGYYRIVLGEVLDNGRYHVFSNLGKGMFSAVVKARVVKPDPRTGEVVGQEVAIKIIRSQESMYKAGLKEIQILNKLREHDPDDKKHVVQLERTFEHRGHLCMVFESLSMNLRDVIKRFGKDLGLNLKAVRAYSHQMFLALSLMKKCSIMHADIKPDNILVTENKSVLKVCDLGSASHESENDITPYLVSRFYRAPEIILGLPYDCSLDVWSIGCTLYELYTGKILFPGRTNNQMLLHMMELKGKVSHRMIKKAQFGNVHFDEGLNFLSCEIDKSTGQSAIKVLPISKPTRDLRARLLPSAVVQSRMRDDELKFLLSFVDLLDKCLHLDPAKRITPKEALQHPFLRAGTAA